MIPECPSAQGLALDSRQGFRTRLRKWAPKIAAGVSDQAFASGANAILNIALARWLSVGEYGIFCLGSTIFLIASGFHNALILEPVSVLGASHFVSHIRVYLRNVFFFQLSLSLLMTGLLAAIATLGPVGPEAKAALLGAAILAPPTLATLYFRRTQYLVGCPQKAAWVSALYAVALFILFSVAEHHGGISALAGFSLMAVAAVIACAPCFHLVLASGLLPSYTSAARAHWNFGKWFVTAPFLAVGTNHIQVLVVASCMGMVGTGALRAMLNFAMPVIQLVTALSNLALPSLARTYNEQPAQFKAAARKLVFSYGAGGFVYMVMLCLFGRHLEVLIYEGKFRTSVSTLPFFGLWIFAVCVSNALGVVLRSRQAPKDCLLALIAASAFGFITSKPLIMAYGVRGAAISMAGTYIVNAIVQIVAYHRSPTSPGASRLQGLTA